MRAHPESVAWSPAPRTEPVASKLEPTLLLAVPEADLKHYQVGAFRRLSAHTTADTMRLLAREKPGFVIIDWDAPELDGPAICKAAASMPDTRVLATFSVPTRVPAALKAGCHGVLLKPIIPSLLATRLGRLGRDGGVATDRLSAFGDRGTNRLWPQTVCPQCQANGATSFEFSSHRRMWYACLACDGVWLGRRQE